MLTRTRRQDFSALRQRAEISAAEDQDPTVLSPAEVQRLLHELQVHQIELEMQNEELRQTQAELEWSRQCYFDLYNQAPVGYITVTSSGYIHEANLKAAALLGMQPGELVGRPLGRFFLPSDYDDFYRRHRQLLRTGEPQACDGRLAPRAPGAAITWVCLDLALAQTGPDTRLPQGQERPGDLCRVMLSDITERKRTETGLWLGAEKYRGLLESLDSAVAVVDNVARLSYANDVAAGQMGRPAEELVGKTLFELFPAETAARLMELIRAAIGEDNGTVAELKMPMAGYPRWYRASVQPIHDEDGRVIYALINAVDIHDLKAAHEKLAELSHTLEERVRQRSAEAQDLYDHAPCGYHSLDAAGNIVMMNQTELDWLGYRREELIGQNITRIFAPRSALVFEGLFSRLKAMGALDDLELDLIRKDGTVLPVAARAVAVYYEDGQFQASRTTLFDVSERKQVEQRLRFQAELLRMVGQPAVGTDLQGRITYWNDAAEALLGWTAAETIGRTTEETFAASAPRAQLEEIRATVRAGQTWAGEVQVQRRDGSLLWTHATDAPVRDSTGQPIGIVSVAYDITAQKQAGEAVRLANIELQRALRLKDEFLANMSHELRTPLSAILSLSEALTDQIGGPLTDKQMRYVQIIGESGNHLLELINSILDLARISAGKMDLELTQVDVPAVAQASIRMVRELALRKNHHLVLEMDPAVTRIMADVRRLRQMLVNLLSNAVKFTPDGGTVGLEVRGDCEEECLNFAVWDTGIGIKPEDLARLFQPFTQLDAGLARTAEGSGLGLALVSQMAGLHGGSVSVESEPGQGSRFTVSIPWLPAEGEARTCADALNAAAQRHREGCTGGVSAPAIGGRRPKVLIVDDSEVSKLFVSDYLSARGYAVFTARDGNEGIFEARRNQPDIILMDVMMPGMDGIATTRRIRSISDLQETPIIALTALVMPGDRERCLEAGMDDYLSKPVKLEHLARVIGEHLAHASCPSESQPACG